MTPRLWGQNCKFFTTPLTRNSQKRLENQTKYKKNDQKVWESCQNFNVSNVGYYGELSESRSTHSRLLSRVALAWFLATPPNGKLVRRLARKENGEPSGGLHWERKGSLHSPTFCVLPTKEPGLRPQTFVFFCLNPVRHWWNNWGIFFEFYTVKPVATPAWNV